MRRIVHSLLTLFLASMLFPAVSSAEAAFQLGVGANVPNDPNVNGFRLSIGYGKNQSMSGLDLGMVSWSESATMSGLGLIMGIHKLTGNMDSGAAFSLINFHGGHDSGMNAAFINMLGDPSDAFNTGFVTIADGGTFFDLGGFNKSKRSKVQFGFINMTDEIENFQLGFLNMAKNGFFPIFPIFNFPKN